ncbi:PQQ-like beta-propeller repeat protein [Candidatus Bathyarchaeota archaeon]|nr:PQQ-like beta-propeller repeat protein [Candidatus Bathyarchaeota archaeon]
MPGGKRKSALFFLLLAINILLTPNLRSSTVSATTNADSVNLLEANVLWERTYGGAGDDRAFYAATVSDGFVVVGSSTSFQQDKTVAWVLRLDHDGNALWNQTFFEGAGSEFRFVLCLEDGFLLVGNVFLPSGDTDGYVVRVDEEGKMGWNITLGGKEVDKLFSALKVQDGFVFVGLTHSFGNDSEVWVVKTDFNGNEVWNKTYGGTTEDAGRAIAPIEGNHFVVAGYTNSMGNGDYDFLLLKIDASGNIAWNKTYGGTQSDKAYAIAETEGECVAVGDTRSKGEGESDAWIIKVDANGNLVWERTVGGEGFDMPTCITVSSYQGYLVGGFTFSFGNGERDFWLFKVDDSGNVQWSCTVGRTEFEEAYAVLEVAENEFVMAGWTNSIGHGHYDFYVAKVSVENDGDWLSAYNFIASALILSAIVIVALVVVFFLIRRYVNQKISRRNVNAV